MVDKDMNMHTGEVFPIKTITLSTTETIKQKVNFIDSYVSKIDYRTNTIDYFNIEELYTQNGKRTISINESKKDIVFKNNSIVKVKYNDHLYNNFIKSKAFYYNNDELVCIKVFEILPNTDNKSTLYKRTIYVYDNKPILDSDLLNSTNTSTDLVVLGQEYLKNEYQSLN
ncbi:hypothetical protein HGB55_12870 [Lutibacter sp. B1]|nr:hypothetical protein [Lutibacter sp. B1]